MPGRFKDQREPAMKRASSTDVAPLSKAAALKASMWQFPSTGATQGKPSGKVRMRPQCAKSSIRVTPTQHFQLRASSEH
eukprot:2269557-Amphidinium_carterae.2